MSEIYYLVILSKGHHSTLNEGVNNSSFFMGYPKNRFYISMRISDTDTFIINFVNYSYVYKIYYLKSVNFYITIMIY